jgi:hypothetical protein
MSAEALFSICNTAVLPGWLLLILAPRWKWSGRLIGAALLPGLLGLVYIALLATHFPGAKGGFGSLEGVAQLFSDPYLLLAGWVHYLAFDLFVGSWEVRDAVRLGIRHWYVIPCLVLTFLAGPTGLVLYLVLRGLLKRELSIGANHA